MVLSYLDRGVFILIIVVASTMERMISGPVEHATPSEVLVGRQCLIYFLKPILFELIIDTYQHRGGILCVYSRDHDLRKQVFLVKELKDIVFEMRTVLSNDRELEV